VFSRLLQRQFSLGLLKGIKMAQTCLPITHLLFADNLLIFGKATSSEASTIKDFLDSYCKWSGQAINIDKSSILFSKNTTTSPINSIKSILPLKLLQQKLNIWDFHFSLGNQKKKKSIPRYLDKNARKN
jgi:hypothetical protein